MACQENSFLAEHIALLDQVLATSTDHIYVFDRAGRYQYASASGLAVLGLQASDIVGKSWRDLNFPAEVMERHDAQRESVFQTGVPITADTSFPTTDGVRYYEYVISPIRDENGAITAVTNTSRDITDRKQTEAALQRLAADLEARVAARTEDLTALNQLLRGEIADRKQAEAELRQSEERYRAIAHNVPNGAVHIFDQDLRYRLSDGAEMRRVGLDKEHLEGHTPQEALPPETAAVLEPCYRAALAGETTTTELVFADQIYRIYTVPLRNEQGEIHAGLSMSQNVTLLKQAEQTLRTARDELERQVQARTQELRVTNELLQRREREFRTLVENTPDVITRHDRQYRCVYINPASLHALGQPPEFFLGKTPAELGYPDDLAQFWKTSLESVFVTGQMRIDEFTVMGEDGPLYFQVYVVPEQEADQSIPSVMTIGRDVTRLRQSEAAAQQLAAELQRSNQELEQFAYIASHDLQEPLRAIASFTQLLAKRYQGQLDAKADTYIEFIVDGATRMQQLIRDLLAYSRAGRHELKPQLVDCQALLEGVKQDLQITIAENAATITADPLPTVMADPSQFGNLLQNLISNALKYRRELPPQIHIAARKALLGSEEHDAAEPSSLSQPHESEAWVFSLQDNGIGIEPQYAKRIFGIFQRLHTREEYPGTGLGLAICRKIIERHGGRIWVESQLGQGSTFFFTLPISTELDDDHPPQTAANSPG